MKKTNAPKNRHDRARENALRQIAQMGPFVEGSLCKIQRPGRSAPSWQLTYKKQGKTHTVYVPVDMVKEVREWTKEYRRLKRLIRKVTTQSLAVIHGHVASRRAASRGRASTQP